jgi:hypothetical protein
VNELLPVGCCFSLLLGKFLLLGANQALRWPPSSSSHVLPRQSSPSMAVSHIDILTARVCARSEGR